VISVRFLPLAQSLAVALVVMEMIITDHHQHDESKNRTTTFSDNSNRSGSYQIIVFDTNTNRLKQKFVTSY